MTFWSGGGYNPYTDKKYIKIFLIYKEIQMDPEQSYIWLTASSYMVKYLRISSYCIRKPFLIYDFAPDPIWISLYTRKICFIFYQCILSLSLHIAWRFNRQSARPVWRPLSNPFFGRRKNIFTAFRARNPPPPPPTSISHHIKQMYS